jgi:hypothetical protein
MARTRSLEEKGDWLAYEIAMFRQCADRAQEVRRAPEDFWTCLLVEGFALHLHALVEFFYPRPHAENEEVATVYDFLDKLRWDEARPLEYSAFQRYECLAVRQVAHLTYVLPDGGRRESMGLSDCREKMERVIARFLSRLPQSRCSGFLAELRERERA